MHKARIIEEITRHAWMITEPALDAILSVVDGGGLSESSYALFHARSEENKLSSQDQFGRSVPGSYYSSIDNGVGYLMVDGPLIPRATLFSDVSGMVSVQALTAEFVAMEKNPAVREIVLLMDSPGGVASGISDFASLVKSSEKPTSAFVWMAASAAYWIASAVDTMVTSDTGMVGSIGTVLSFSDSTEAEKKRGIRSVEIVSSQSPDKRPDHNTPDGIAVYQKLVDDLSAVFISAVAVNRGVSVDTVLSDFGRGAMRVGNEAVSLGMADKVMSLGSFQSSVSSENQNRTFLNPAAMRQSNTSAKAENKEENEMSKTPEQIAAEEKAIEEKIAAATVKATENERIRVKGIEALKANFDAALPDVKAKAVKAIDEMKFDADATPENVSMRLLPIVAQAQAGALSSEAENRRAAADIAAKVSAKDAPEDKAGSASASHAVKVKSLVNAINAQDGKVNNG